MRARVVNLADLMPGVTIPRLSAALQEAFEEEYGPAETGRFPDRERVEAYAALLRSDDWIYGRRIPATQIWKGPSPGETLNCAWWYGRALFAKPAL